MNSLVCAANPIKEVLTAPECLREMQSALQQSKVTCPVTQLVISDGGDGFLHAVDFHHTLETIYFECIAPLGDVITAPVLFHRETHTAYIESALCCGLSLIPPQRRNVMMSGTAGLADLLVAAINHGARKIYVGLGGSATCDGGAGFLWKLACHSGQFPPGACEPRTAIDLAECAPPDLTHISQWLGDRQLIVCADVDNPLLGINGTATVFAPQKGAAPDEVDQLEAWMTCWAQRVERHLGASLAHIPGAGAAGGLGFALAAIGAEIVPGSQMVAELAGLPATLKPGALLITNEGRFDQTSLHGKAPWTAAHMAIEAGASAAIFCAVADAEAADQARAIGVDIIEFAPDLPADQRTAHTPRMLRESISAYITAKNPAAQ